MPQLEEIDIPHPFAHDPPYAIPARPPKADDPEVKAAKLAAEKMIVVIPSTPDLPKNFAIPLGPSRFANGVRAKGCDVAFTYAKAIQPPTTLADGRTAKGASHVVESIAVHFRRAALRGWACWWALSTGQVKGAGAGYLDARDGIMREAGTEAILKILEENQ